MRNWENSEEKFWSRRDRPRRSRPFFPALPVRPFDALKPRSLDKADSYGYFVSTIMKRLGAFALILLMLHASAAWALQICPPHDADRFQARSPDNRSHDDDHSSVQPANLHCFDVGDDIGPLLQTSDRYSKVYRSLVESVSFSSQIALNCECCAKALGVELSLPLLKGSSPHLYLSVLRI